MKNYLISSSKKGVVYFGKDAAQADQYYDFYSNKWALREAGETFELYSGEDLGDQPTFKVVDANGVTIGVGLNYHEASDLSSVWDGVTYIYDDRGVKPIVVGSTEIKDGKVYHNGSLFCTTEALVKTCGIIFDLNDMSALERLDSDISDYTLTTNTARNGRPVIWYMNELMEFCYYLDDYTELSAEEIEEQLH